MNVDRKSLELELEKTPEYIKPKEHLEQYITPAMIASEVLWEAFMRGDIGDKTVLDLGCGTLRLGMGALYLGARRVVGVDIDYDVLEQTMKWLRGIPEYKYKVLLIQGDAQAISLVNIDTTIMNPPFGVKRHNRGMDLVFLRKALEISRTVYTMHKDSPGLRRIINNIVESMDLKITYFKEGRYPIKMTLLHHRRRIHWINIVIYGLRWRQ